MRTHPDCVPCFLKQALRVARLVDASAEREEALLRHVLRWLADVSYDVPSPRIAQHFYPMLAEHLGCADPFAEVRRVQTRRALELLPTLRARVRAADSPVRTAVKLSLAGNLVDLGAEQQFDLMEFLQRILDTEPTVDHIERFEERLRRAQRVLILADNAGEIVFDRLLVETALREKQVTVAVRSGPIINDATRLEAGQSGLGEIAQIIDPGPVLPGIWLEASQEGFRRAVADADLIVSKGQGNFETFGEHKGAPCFYVFMVKCGVVGRALGLRTGDSVAAFAPCG